MNRASKSALRAIGLVLLCLPALCACAERRAEPPAAGAGAKLNIVLVMIDDMGVNDVGAYGGSAARTPNLDAPAREGVRFTRHYTDSTCAATRVGVLTGTEPARHGFRPDHRGISPEVTTLPEALKAQGYATHHIGKWHLGHTTRLAWPTAQGFDSFFGFLHQWLLRGPHRDGDWKLNKPTYINPWLQEQAAPPRRHQGHLSEILAQRAVALIEAKRGAEQPWFLNLWLYAPHSPLEPSAAFSRQYPDTPSGRYLAMVSQADDTVGQVMRALDRSGLAANTLLLVASDNGGSGKHFASNQPFHGAKAMYLEGGVRTPLLLRWPEVLPAGASFEGVVSNFDYYPTLVAAAGGTPDVALVGRDLRKLLAGEGAPAPLFWETANAEHSSWGSLSADGRWRAFQFYLGEPQLFDLREDPAGALDVSGAHPELAEQQHRAYLAWRYRMRELDLNYRPLDESGRATLTGHSLQRSPGFGGFTFAIDYYAHGTPPAAGREIIALQENQWMLSRRGPEIELRVSDARVKAPAPRGQGCTSIIVTSHHAHSTIYRRQNPAVIELYIDGELAARQQLDNPPLPADDYLEPTFIGQDSAGQRVFRGRLSRPRVYNERVVLDPESQQKIGNGVERIMEGACRPDSR